MEDAIKVYLWNGEGWIYKATTHAFSSRAACREYYALMYATSIANIRCEWDIS